MRTPGRDRKQLDEASRRAIKQLLDSDILEATAIAGGFTAAQCWSLTTADGRSVFVKIATDEDAIAGNRIESIVLVR